MKTLRTNATANRVPETPSDCLSISCDECVMTKFTDTITKCEHRKSLVEEQQRGTIAPDECTNTPTETDPTGRKSTDPGAKLDEGKVLAGALGDFGFALEEVAKVSTHGIHKYSRGGWRSVPDGELRYTDAMWRHLLAEGHETIDQDSGLHHAAHLAWNALARLELIMGTEL